jgi:SAM-dependent methyltransferase
MLSAGTGDWNDMTPSRYSQQIDLDDINNARSLGILLVPDGSRVLDIGTADGSVARGLADRGCRLWGIEVDADAARDAERWCDRVIVGDVELLDWHASMDGQLFDVVLLLDVLEHLRDPLQTLRRAVSFLAPGGRIVASIRNVAHAAVRLQLLDGRFERTDLGLLDRTNIQFFDRRSVDRLLTDAGLVQVEDLQVLRRIDETEIRVDLSTFPAETLRMIAADPEAQVYQFVIAAVPASASARWTHDPSLAGALQKQVVKFRELESWAWSLEAQIRGSRAADGGPVALDDRLSEGELMIELARIRDEHVRVAAELSVRERALKEREQAAATRSSEVALLRRDLLIKEAYLAELRIALDRRPTAADLEAVRYEKDTHLAELRQELDQRPTTAALDALRHEKNSLVDDVRAEFDRRLAAGAHEVAAKAACIAELQETIAARDAAHAASMAEKDARVAALQAELQQRPTRAAYDALQQRPTRAAYDALAAELAQFRETMRATLAFPRYRVADRLNNILRLTGPLHAWMRKATARALKRD